MFFLKGRSPHCRVPRLLGRQQRDEWSYVVVRSSSRVAVLQNDRHSPRRPQASTQEDRKS
jgi:hypothetical protein